MTGKEKCRKTAALLLALIFALVTVISTASVSAYAAAGPDKVTGVKATGKSTSSIRITWKKAAGAEKYQVYRSTSETGKFGLVGTKTGLSFTNKKLKTGKKYFYKVRAVSGDKKGRFSAVKSATTKVPLKAVIVDKEARTVTIKAKVNGKYFGKSTRHFMVDRKGFNKGTGILTSYCTPKDLYRGLVKAGGVSWSKSAGKTLRNGEKNTASNAENKNFSRIDVTVSYKGETYPLSECLTTKKGGSSAPKIKMVFSGNPKAAARTPSGCMVCMDSCYIGIVANSSYGLCVIDKGKPKLYGRRDVLPEDGEIVDVIFKVRK